MADQVMCNRAGFTRPTGLSLEDMREAVRLTAGRAKLEASGGISDSTLRVIAETGVNDDFIGTNRGLSLVFSENRTSGGVGGVTGLSRHLDPIRATSITDPAW